jgi:DNA-binding NtrC family response regulator
VITNELFMAERPLNQTIPVLIVSANQKDHARVRLLLNPVNCQFYGASTFAEARKIVREHVIAVVVTEAALTDGKWTTLFVCTGPKANPPNIIPLAELGDYGFWAEAFNRGAFDVLYRPLLETSIARVVTLAFQRWKRAAERQDARDGNTQVTVIWPSRRSRSHTAQPKWIAPKVLAVAEKSFAATQGSSRLVWW